MDVFRCGYIDDAGRGTHAIKTCDKMDDLRYRDKRAFGSAMTFPIFDWIKSDRETLDLPKLSEQAARGRNTREQARPAPRHPRAGAAFEASC